MKKLLILGMLLLGNISHAHLDLKDRLLQNADSLARTYVYIGKAKEIPIKDLNKLAINLESDLVELEVMVITTKHPYNEFQQLLNNYKIFLSDLSLLNARRNGNHVLQEELVYQLRDRIRIKEDIKYLLDGMDKMRNVFFSESY